MRAAALGLAAWLSFGAARSAACSCSGQGPSSALTRPDQTWGVRSSQRLVLGTGDFNAHGKYRAFSPAEHDRTLEYALLVARRWRRLELAAMLSYGTRAAVISGQAEEQQGLGDTTLRVRYEAANEPAPWQGGSYPALAMLVQVRLPTAKATGLAPRGIGAVEFALGVAVERSVLRSFRLGLLADVAGRMPDTTLGSTRRLGPRANAEFTLSYFASPDWILSALLALSWEGNVSDQRGQQSGTAQRSGELGFAAAFQPWDQPFRTGFVARYAPGVDVLGANSVAGLTSELWLGFVR